MLSSGYCFSQECPVRETSRTDSCSMKHIARTPSHLTSKSHSSPRGGVSASAAFIGVMAVGMAAFTAPFSDAGLAAGLGLGGGGGGGLPGAFQRGGVGGGCGLGGRRALGGGGGGVARGRFFPFAWGIAG